MSSEALPISPTRFAAALKDLPLSTLHLKATELRNSIAHLDYSNEQLKPFANGTDPSTNGEPDQVCLDAIRENEIVIGRFEERILLLKAEVEGRGCSWLEFQTPAELPPASVLAPSSEETVTVTDPSSNLSNGTTQERSSAWTDGTFQTGRIVDGEVVMDGAGDGVNGSTNVNANPTTNGTTGGRIDDEALRRIMEERMRALETEDDEEGIHL